MGLTNFDNEYQDAWDDLSDHFGEEVRFFSDADNPQRLIQGIVDREGGQFLNNAGEVVSYQLMVEVANNATTGIAMSELNEGQAFIEMYYREGDSTKSKLPVMKILDAVGGVLKLQVA